MKIPVKTLWHGDVGVRGKYLLRCKTTEEPLIIVHDNQYMTIFARNIDTTFDKSSRKPVKDKWGRESDYLYYTRFIPDPAEQRTMF